MANLSSATFASSRVRRRKSYAVLRLLASVATVGGGLRIPRFSTVCWKGLTTAMHERKELLLTRLAIALCLVCLGLAYVDIYSVVRVRGADLGDIVSGIIVAVLVTALVYGALVYMFARHGWIVRQLLPSSSPEQGDRVHLAVEAPVPRVCVLIPSYKEELRVLRQTIISAVLSEYPDRRIVVLIDDPPTSDGAALNALHATREYVDGLHRHIEAAATRFHSLYADFLGRAHRAGCSAAAESTQLADLYDELACWIERLPDVGFSQSGPSDHTDRFFTDAVIAASSQAQRSSARRLRSGVYDVAQLDLAFRRLLVVVNVPVTRFERKRYANLSHAPNKAMNLNSYLGLMGKSFTVIPKDSFRLEECRSGEPDMAVADADYILTLDADSLVLRDYTLKLVHLMQQDCKLAVAQTPYSAIPGSALALERAAGAQTDLQFIVHQGSSRANATFWVGANALLRLSALRDICNYTCERGVTVPVFIQDRTVIEDTGSTVDLIRRGWRLYNHPERLAYSATPPDFGSLIIQRRRWANGGLIIFPDLLRYLFGPSGKRPSWSEFLLRMHYLCGPALTTASVVLLAVLPVDPALLTPWLLATIVPYYALYARDLRFTRYSWSEVLDVYILSLMLLPVTLAGVLRSLHQAITGCKSSFGRTPKVMERTSIPALHHVMQIALTVSIAVIATSHVSAGRIYLGMLFTFNLFCMVSGVVRFIGFRQIQQDLAPTITLRSMLRRMLPNHLLSQRFAWQPARARRPSDENGHRQTLPRRSGR